MRRPTVIVTLHPLGITGPTAATSSWRHMALWCHYRPATVLQRSLHPLLILPLFFAVTFPQRPQSLPRSAAIKTPDLPLSSNNVSILVRAVSIAVDNAPRKDATGRNTTSTLLDLNMALYEPYTTEVKIVLTKHVSIPSKGALQNLALLLVKVGDAPFQQVNQESHQQPAHPFHGILANK
ncbi:hypothetical protein E2C01_021259 [Portunus trituberculatus]|uniref:Uncharacterized protein n=1 Tax=Portunus trituberculatus TaxID=210409 RepID=A0A5B7E3W9_PORTR|nr:hypothetical protein [Portunus trituberculatus]